jgi:hypothetical protein
MLSSRVMSYLLRMAEPLMDSSIVHTGGTFGYSKFVLVESVITPGREMDVRGGLILVRSMGTF